MSSIYLEPDELEAHERQLEAKYVRAREDEPRHELYERKTLKSWWWAYGIVSRVLRSDGRKSARGGLHVGLVPAHHSLAVSVNGLGQRGGASRRTCWWWS